MDNPVETAFQVIGFSTVVVVIIAGISFPLASTENEKITKQKPFELKGKIYKCIEVKYEN